MAKPDKAAQVMTSDEWESDRPEALLAATAAVMADRSRAGMLCALMDGRAWTATELSAVADISASTASAHLARLVEQRFVVCLSQGRHRYYKLAGAGIAELLERLMGVSWANPAAFRVTTPVHLRRARTCYDHLAGEVAVEIYQWLVQQAWISADGSALTPSGQAHLTALGINCENGASRRRHCCPCLDWSERRHHLGGALGAALLAHFEQQRWVEREVGSRGMRITPKGARALKRHFAVMV